MDHLRAAPDATGAGIEVRLSPRFMCALNSVANAGFTEGHDRIHHSTVWPHSKRDVFSKKFLGLLKQRRRLSADVHSAGADIPDSFRSVNDRGGQKVSKVSALALSIGTQFETDGGPYLVFNRLQVASWWAGEGAKCRINDPEHAAELDRPDQSMAATAAEMTAPERFGETF